MAIDSRNYDPAMAANGVGIRAGAGAPTESAPKGTIYVNHTGSSTSTRMYVNTDGASTWTAFTTAA